MINSGGEVTGVIKQGRLDMLGVGETCKKKCKAWVYGNDHGKLWEGIEKNVLKA